MKNNKKYKKPKISAVELDAKQAILQVCKVEGLYMKFVEFAGIGSVCVQTGTGFACDVSVKGITAPQGALASENVDDKPS
ncbi:MAG: hypothetical protein PHQ52_03450 [Candidatus Omnitrophica bacterium]|nr:hypothetical protein [Candidatus Omnitrophota bacterium]